MRILVVDDHEPSLHVVTGILRKHGFTVIQAGGAAEALEMTRREKPRLALCDVHLGDGNGYAVCRDLRRIAPDLVVILMSATYRDEASRQTAIFAGAADFLPQPISPSTLLEAVRTHLPAA